MATSARVRLTEGTAPSTPPSGTAEIFYDDATNPGVLKIKKDDGTTVTIEATAGADADAIHDNQANEISAITEKAAPVGADIIIIEDSEAGYIKKMVQITNLPAGAEVNDLAGDGISGIADDQLAVGTGAGTAAYQTLPDGAVAYDTTGGTFSQASSSDLSDGPFVNGDADAIHDNVSGEIAVVAEKTTLVGDDLLLIEDSEATNAKKRVKVSNLPAGSLPATVVETDQTNTYSTGTQDFLLATAVYVTDSTFSIKDNVDATKVAQFQCSGITTSTTRTYTLPNSDGTILLSGAMSLDDLSDVTLTTPATGSVLVKSAGDWVDGQVDLADTDAVTGVLPTGNIAATLTGKVLQDCSLTVIGGDLAIDCRQDAATTLVDIVNTGTGAAKCSLRVDGSLIFQNGTAVDMVLTGTPTTSTKTITFPDASGTVVLAGSLNATTMTVANEATDTTCFPTFVTAATGDLGPKSNASLTFDSNTATLACTNINATTFTGALSGNASTATSATTAGACTGNSATVTVANEATDVTCFPLFAVSATGSLEPKTNAALTFDSSTANLACTTFTGALNGNASSATTASACSGNSATVTVADAGGDTTTWVLLGTAQTGSLAPATDAGITYNATDNSLTTTTFIGALTGNASSASTAAACSGNSATVTVANEATDTTCFPLFATAASGSLEPKTNTGFTYNSSTNALTTGTINGTTIPSSKTLVVTTDKLSVLAATSSSELAGVISDETGSGALVFGTSPTLDCGGSTSVEIPNGAGGTTLDAAGEVCVDTTSKTVNFYSDAEYVLNPILSKSISIEDPTNAEDITLFYTNSAITITQIRAVLVGSSTPSVTWTIRHSDTTRSNAGTEAVTSGTTTTSTTTGSNVTSFNDATATAGWVWLETTAKSGTVDELHVTIYYKQDP